LQFFNNGKKLDDNIKNNFLNSDEPLFEEPTNLLKQELREPALYNSIITAVATGSTKVNEIETKTGLESSTCVKYLKNLIELGIIKREIPVLEKATSKKSIYRLNDGMFRFWYRFVYKNISKIGLGLGGQVYDDIKDQIPDFMGEVFEQICNEYMWKTKLPFSASEIGRWWGNNPIKKAEQEKENSYQELITTIKGNPGMEHLDNLLGQIDIAQTYCESVCYLVGLTDGIRLRNIFDL